MWLSLGVYVGPKRSHAFTQFFKAQLFASIEDLIYRRYVTDALMYIGQGKGIAGSWYDLVKPSAPDFDAEKIADDIVARLGGDVG